MWTRWKLGRRDGSVCWGWMGGEGVGWRITVCAFALFLCQYWLIPRAWAGTHIIVPGGV